RARLLHLLVGVAEPASFDGSTRSVGAGVKEENNRFPAQILERDIFPVLVLQSKVGSLIIDIHDFSRRIEAQRRERRETGVRPSSLRQDFTPQDFIPRIASIRAIDLRYIVVRRHLGAGG